MAKLKVYWSETALKQRNHTFKYWNQRNKSTSYTKRLLSVINDRINTLIVFPNIGKKVEFKNTRVISLEHFSLFLSN